MPFDDDELNKQYTSDDDGHDADSDDVNGDDYVENESGTIQNVDSKLSSDECSHN